jgi:Putative zinc binding domain
MNENVHVVLENAAAFQAVPRKLRSGSCGSAQTASFIDLGMSPLCESFVSANWLNAMEPSYPLHALICSNCLLVQLDQYVTAADVFSEYAYFSWYSDACHRPPIELRTYWTSRWRPRTYSWTPVQQSWRY